MANNAGYAKALKEGTTYWEGETLTPVQRTNERLMTGLRTQWGVEIEALEVDALRINSSALERYVSKGQAMVRDGRLVLI